MTHQDYGRIARELGSTSNLALSRCLIKHLSVNARTTIADLGCGAGGDAATIARMTGSRLIGIDRDMAMLSLVPDVVSPVLSCAEAMSIRDESADAAYSVNLMQILSDRRRLFSEAARILRRGGRFALYVTTRKQLRRRFLNEFFPGLLDLELTRYPSMATLRGELKTSGFEAVLCRTADLGSFVVDEQYVKRQRTGIFSGVGLLPRDIRERGFLALERHVRSLRCRGCAPCVPWIRTIVIARRPR